MHYAPATATLTGDYVGVESCIDLRNEEDFEEFERECVKSYERRRMVRKAEAEVAEDRRRMEEREVREFPPPIKSLARTENQPSHMAWVMRRYYTADGRLVIREEKVRRHEYFRAFRADGRLTLQLIPMDGCDDDDDDADDVDVEGGCSVVVDDDDVDVQSCTDVVVDDAVNEGEDGEEKDEEKEKMEKEEDDVDDETVMTAPVMVSSASMSALCITEGVNGGRGMLASASFSSLCPSGGGGGGGGGAKKCYGFNSLRSSSASCLFHLQVPAIRPVII